MSNTYSSIMSNNVISSDHWTVEVIYKNGSSCRHELGYSAALDMFAFFIKTFVKQPAIKCEINLYDNNFNLTKSYKEF